MGNAPMDTSLLDKAMIYAINAHKNTERRGKGTPYIIHPMEAVAIVETLTRDQELLAAAALHDVVEDTDCTFEDIKKEFGDRIANLVASESDLVIDDGRKEEETWKERKQYAIDRLAKASHDEKIVAIGDKLSNARAIYRDYKTLGDELWNRFHIKDKNSYEWYYRGLVSSLSELSGTFAFEEFKDTIDKIFEKK